MKVFRITAILEWFDVILFAGMGYVLALMLWDSHLLGIAAAIGLPVIMVLVFMPFRSFRRLHRDTWRLLRKGLPLDTLK